MDKASDTEYVDKVIKQDGTVCVKVRQRSRGEPDSDSSFDHASEFKLDKQAMSPLKSLQEIRGKKRTHSLNLPPPNATSASAVSPGPGPSLVRTSTPNGPGAVMAAFGGSSKNNDSLDDTIEGFVDMGELSNSDIISMGQPPMIHNGTSGDDSDTLDADDFNQRIISHDQDYARVDADDEEEQPNLQAQGHLLFCP